MITVDRFLRYDELTSSLHDVAAEYPNLVEVTSIGQSHEGREIWLTTVTDASTGPHAEKPAQWVDANIHSVELTASASALNLINRLTSAYGDDPVVTRALQTRTFYIVARVNPDGAEWAMADSPRFRRSSVRAWPWVDAHQPTGLERQDIDGNGTIRTMRVPDPNGGWMCNPDEPRQMVLVPITGTDQPRYRLLDEGPIEGYDGFTVPTPRPAQGLDMNRNYPAGWGTNVTGSGDYPGSEPEIAALLKAMRARPNICGFNAYHTSGGVLLRPSSTKADSALTPLDVWTFGQLGKRCTELTSYPVHSVFEDFTWDKTDTMAGASDDWAFEHLGVYAWTTEYWDLVHAATSERSSTDIWFLGPTAEQDLACLQWAAANHPELYGDWTPFDHPQLGAVEIGGWDQLYSWTNPPIARLAAEVAAHADFAIFQALAAPSVAIVQTTATHLGGDSWQVEAGIANTGWLPTTVTEHARKNHLVLPLVASITGVTVIGGTLRQELGQLSGRSALQFSGTSDGTSDRVLARWTVLASAGSTVEVIVTHSRAGTARATLTLEN